MKKTISIALALASGMVVSVANAEFIWGPPVNLGPNVNSSANDGGASISADGLTLYFSSNRSGGFGGYDLWCTTRATINDDWDPAVNLGHPPTRNTLTGNQASLRMVCRCTSQTATRPSSATDCPAASAVRATYGWSHELRSRIRGANRSILGPRSTVSMQIIRASQQMDCHSTFNPIGLVDWEVTVT